MTKDEAIAEAKALLDEVEAFKPMLTIPGIATFKNLFVRTCRLLVYAVSR